MRALSVAALTGGLVISVQIGSFLHDSSVHGGALIRQLRRAIAVAGRSPRACPHRGHPPGNAGRAGGTAARGLLEIPALGLVAPVRAGASDAVLADSVGHVWSSAWPGSHGTAVFSAHNVTWFSRIGSLRHADVIRYLTPCRSYTYRVTSHRVVRAGIPLYNTPAPALVLETCYPTDALYLTSSRYLVFAALVSAPAAGAAPSRPHLAAPSLTVPAPRGLAGPALTVPAPKALADQGLSLSRNQAPLGTLSLSGAPAAAWRQANAPMRAEAAALTEYFGLIRSASQEQRRWWEDLAPSVPVSAAAGLWGGQITSYDRKIKVRLRVRGDHMLGATLTTELTTSGPARQGTFLVWVSETVTRWGELLASGFRMRPASS